MRNAEKEAYFDAIHHTRTQEFQDRGYREIEETVEEKRVKAQLQLEKKELSNAVELVNVAINNNDNVKEAMLNLLHTLTKYGKLHTDFSFCSYISDFFPRGTYGSFSFSNVLKRDFTINFDSGNMQSNYYNNNLYNCFGITMGSDRIIHYDVSFIQRLYLMAKEQIPNYARQTPLSEEDFSTCTRIISCTDGQYSDDIEMKMLASDKEKYTLKNVEKIRSSAKRKYVHHQDALEDESIKSLNSFLQANGLGIVDILKRDGKFLFFGLRENQSLDYDWALRLGQLHGKDRPVAFKTTYDGLKIKPNLTKLNIVMQQMYDAYDEFLADYINQRQVQKQRS